jgi:hypothetical protein
MRVRKKGSKKISEKLKKGLTGDILCDLVLSIMLKDIKTAVGGAFLALGLLGGSVYGRIAPKPLESFLAYIYFNDGITNAIPGFINDDVDDIEIDEIEVIDAETMEVIAGLDLPELMQYVNQGANLNCRDEYGQTVLHYSLPPDVLRYVLARREIDLNTRDNDGNTPLHAIMNLGEARALIRAGANPLLRNNAGQTPREVFEQSYSVACGNTIEYVSCVRFLQDAEDAYRQGTMDDFIQNIQD